MTSKIQDKKFFNINGGLDTRAEIDKDNKRILYLEGAKNIDINGKIITRAKGQTTKLQISGEGISYIGSQEISGVDYMRCITNADKYYRISGAWAVTLAKNFTAGAFSTALYASKSYALTGLGTNLYGFRWINSDKTKFIVLDASNKYVRQYSCSTAGNISTSSSDSKSFYVGSQSSSPCGMVISSDFTKMYIQDSTSKVIYQYNFNNTDISTSSYASKSYTPSIANTPTGLGISNDGTKIYIAGSAAKEYYQLDLGTAYDITTSAYNTKKITQHGSGGRQIYFTSDGNYMFVPESNTSIAKYGLSTPWVLTTATWISSLTVTSYGNAPTGVDFNNDGQKMYVLSDADNAVYQWDTPAFPDALTLRPHMFQFHENLVVITGKSDPFIDDGSAITQTGFRTQWDVYGSIGITFTNRTFIADGKTIYWTEANTANQWNADYYKQFDSEIIDLKLYGAYLMIWTKSKVWYLSGTSESDFSFQEWGTRGVLTKFANCELDNNLYTFIKNGLFPIETTGDMAQTRFIQSLTDNVANLLEEVDQDRLDEVIIVPYGNRKQIWCYLPISGNSTIYKAYIFNFINKAENGEPISIYTRESNAITCAVEFKGNIYTGTSSGKIYLEDSGDSFDGNIIYADMKFTEMSFGSSKIKRLKDFMIWMNPNNSNKFTFYYILDGNIYNKKTIDIDLSAKQSDNKDRISRYIPIAPDQFTNIQIGISTDALDEDFELLGFEFLGLLLSNSINQI